MALHCGQLLQFRPCSPGPQCYQLCLPIRCQLPLCGNHHRMAECIQGSKSLSTLVLIRGQVFDCLMFGWASIFAAVSSCTLGPCDVRFHVVMFVAPFRNHAQLQTSSCKLPYDMFEMTTPCKSTKFTRIHKNSPEYIATRSSQCPGTISCLTHSLAVNRQLALQLGTTSMG